MSYRTAVVGLVSCVLLSAAWMHALGMAYWYALFQLLVLFLVIAIVMARSTAESGLPMTEGSFTPIDIYRVAARPRTLGAANLTMFAFTDPSSRATCGASSSPASSTGRRPSPVGATSPSTTTPRIRTRPASRSTSKA